MKYIILPGKNPPPEDAIFHQIAYDFWYNHWFEFFKKHDPNYILNPDDFFRQDFIGLIADQTTPVAIHLYSIFDVTLDHQLKHSYLNYNFSPQFFKKLIKMNVKRAMTFEALLVNPLFRKTETGRSIAPLLFAQGIQLLKSIDDVEAMIAPARSDIGVAQLAHSCGAITIEHQDLHGIPVSLIVGMKEKLNLNFLNEFERRKAIQIFNNRQDNITLNRESNGNSKKIAS